MVQQQVISQLLDHSYIVVIRAISVNKFLPFSPVQQIATRIKESIEAWSGEPETLRAWLDRLEQLFILNGASEEQKTASLIVHIGKRGYEIIADLTYPQTPSAKKFNE